MSFESEIRDLAAKSSLEFCKQLTPGAFSHKGQSPVTIYLSAGPERHELRIEGNHSVEFAVRDFFVPRQTSFPPTEGVDPQDTITLLGSVWSIGPFELDSVGAAYVMEGSKLQPQQLGVNS